MSVNGYNDFKRDKTHKSKFKYVYKYVSRKDGEVKWTARFYSDFNNGNAKQYNTEREAAKAVDVFLLNQGKQPVNILVKK